MTVVLTLGLLFLVRGLLPVGLLFLVRGLLPVGLLSLIRGLLSFGLLFLVRGLLAVGALSLVRGLLLSAEGGLLALGALSLALAVRDDQDRRLGVSGGFRRGGVLGKRGNGRGGQTGRHGECDELLAIQHIKDLLGNDLCVSKGRFPFDADIIPRKS